MHKYMIICTFNLNTLMCTQLANVKLSGFFNIRKHQCGSYCPLRRGKRWSCTLLYKINGRSHCSNGVFVQLKAWTAHSQVSEQSESLRCWHASRLLSLLSCRLSFLCSAVNYLLISLDSFSSLLTYILRVLRRDGTMSDTWPETRTFQS